MRSLLGTPARVVAILTALVVAWAAPLEPWDDGATRLVLRALAPPSPPRRVVLLTVSPAEMRDGVCSQGLSRLLTEGGASAALLWSSAATLCAPSAEESAAIVALPRRGVRFGPTGSVDGFEAIDDPRLRALGLEEARWLVAPSRTSVPGVLLADVASGRVGTTPFARRLVVVAMGEESGGGVAVSEEGAGVAAAVGAVLDGGARRSAPRWASGLLGAAMAGALVWALRRRRWVRVVAEVSLALVALVIASDVALARAFAPALLPLASLAAAAASALGVLLVPSALFWRASMARASSLVDRAARLRGASTPRSDGELFSRLAELAAQVHPADFVLIAELPAEHWEMRFWTRDGAGESLVAEGNRDIREAPYADDAGVLGVRLLRRFLVMRDTPVVMVPLSALSELEGYLFLCGDKAEQAFVDDPGVAERLGTDLGLLVRQRRARRADADSGHLPGARAADPLVDDALDRATSAEDALEALELLGALVREAPTALMLADPFGDVQIVGRAMAEVLGHAGIVLPRSGSEAPLPAGTLSLGTVIGTLCEADSREVARTLAELLANPAGIELPVDNAPHPMTLALRALRRESSGISAVAGFVATLCERARTTSAYPPNVTALPSRDGLTVVPIWEVVSAAVGAASKKAGAPVKMASARTSAYVIVQRSTIVPSLTAFLAEAARLGSSSHPPIVAIKEKSLALEISILDLQLGLPLAAIQRVIDAPVAAPPELETLARLLRAVEESQGSVRLKAGGGWGSTLILSMLRARPQPVAMTEATGDASQASEPATALASRKPKRVR